MAKNIPFFLLHFKYTQFKVSVYLEAYAASLIFLVLVRCHQHQGQVLLPRAGLEWRHEERSVLMVPRVTLALAWVLEAPH